ncbi:ABC transporter permease [Actinomadura kijaniata]|uniref:Simple sugar transport system permease protein n=1 Tax=Actinomadura namibiensis TaxID=182080 RepID=A0A7W3QPD9_ACTNM|nr:ABC transporter permease [Actinomadura namibiensis]MBA8954552.1 simple sugar transport system permease protein [Actinomadura namibiensis]
MTAVTEAQPAGAPAKAGPGRRRGLRLLAVLGGVFLMLVLLRVLTGEDAITSGGTFGAALALGVPIGMAALGGLWSERAGVVNIGLEGMMIFGTWGGAYGAFTTGNPWVGLVTGVLMGALGGLLHALATVTFGVDHIVSGVALNILAPGVARYLSTIFFEGKGVSANQSPRLPEFPVLGIPGVKEPLQDLEGRHWFLVSDLAGLVRGFTTDLSALTLLAVALLVGTYFVLWRTAFGLRIRSVGENPYAAESLGVKVMSMKYVAVLVSGALAGFGGVFLAMVASSQYQEGQTGGRGYIGLAAMIFGNWRPGGLAAGTGLFGYTDALQQRGAGGAIHALLLVLAIGLFAYAAWLLWQGRRPTTPAEAAAGPRRRLYQVLASVIVGVLLLVWYLGTDEIPKELVTYSPHITTLLVLSLASQRLRMPAADGVRYRRGEGH